MRKLISLGEWKTFEYAFCLRWHCHKFRRHIGHSILLPTAYMVNVGFIMYLVDVLRWIEMLLKYPRFHTLYEYLLIESPLRISLAYSDILTFWRMKLRWGQPICRIRSVLSYLIEHAMQLVGVRQYQHWSSQQKHCNAHIINYHTCLFHNYGVILTYVMAFCSNWAVSFKQRNAKSGQKRDWLGHGNLRTIWPNKVRTLLHGRWSNNS